MDFKPSILYLEGYEPRRSTDLIVVRFGLCLITTISSQCGVLYWKNTHDRLLAKTMI